MGKTKLLAIGAAAVALAGCGGGPGIPRVNPPSMSYGPGADKDPVPPNVARVELHGPDDNQVATLQAEGRQVCELPCTADISDGVKYWVDVPVTPTKSKRVELPEPVAKKGRTEAFTAVPRKGSPGGAIGITAGGGVFVFVGVLLASSSCGQDPPGTTASESISRRGGCTAGYVSLVLGAGLAAAGLIWLVNSSSARLEPRAVTPSPPRARLTLDGFVF